VPEFLHDAAAMSVLAHLRKLEREGLVEHDGDDWSPR
jgi:predicted transcriptional regulator